MVLFSLRQKKALVVTALYVSLFPPYLFVSEGSPKGWFLTNHFLPKYPSPRKLICFLGVRYLNKKKKRFVKNHFLADPLELF